MRNLARNLLYRLPLLALVLLWAAGAAMAGPAAGTWDCAATTPEGEDLKFVLKVSDEGGRVTGTVEDSRGAGPLIEPKLENSTLTFQVDYDGSRYTLELKIAGDKLEGTYRGDPATGPVKGVRRPPSA